jgi:hypothetical protein
MSGTFFCFTEIKVSYVNHLLKPSPKKRDSAFPWSPDWDIYYYILLASRELKVVRVKQCTVLSTDLATTS